MDNGAIMKRPEIGDLVYLKYTHNDLPDTNIILFVTSVTDDYDSTFGFRVDGMVLYFKSSSEKIIEYIYPTIWGFYRFDKYFIHNKKCSVDEIIMLEEL